jgi:hypothetical protein
MTYYAKLFNNIGAISATYKDANDVDQTVVIAGGGVTTPIPFEVLGLPGVVRAHDAGNLKIYSDSAATVEITAFPNTSVDLPVAATTATAGLVKKMPAQVDSVAADITAMKVDFNALLAKLRTAGILT